MADVTIPDTKPSKSIPRRVIALLLGGLYVLAYVLTPAWMLVAAVPAAYAALAILLATGAAWAFLASGSIRLSGSSKTWVWLSVIVALVAMLNGAALTSVIPWRGDESTFILRTRDLIRRLPLSSVGQLGMAFSVLLIAAALRWRWMLGLGLIAATAAMYVFFQLHAFDGIGATVLLRWPYINYWIFSVVPMAARYLWDFDHEFLYRIVPMLSAASIVWLVLQAASGLGALGKLLWAAAIATIPVLYYYSSILYIELLAALLMTAVCLQAEHLLADDFETIRHNPTWLALVCLGFLKETVLAFLGIFLLVRTGWRIRSFVSSPERHSLAAMKPRILGEMAVWFCTLLPSAVYLGLRSYLISIRSYTRGYSPDLGALLEPSFYQLTARGLASHFGIFILLFITALVLAIRGRRFVWVAFLLAVAIGTVLFYGIDANSVELTGYSRFDLFLLPPILAALAMVLSRIASLGRAAPAALALASLATNLAIAPVHLDGTKLPYWGNYEADISEHYYPYDEALLWLSREHTDQGILFSPMFYEYYLSFYFAKFDWHPNYAIKLSPVGMEDQVSLAGALAEARLKGFELVLFQPRGEAIPQPAEGSGYCLESVFKNQAHQLLLFSSSVNCELQEPQ